MYDARVGRLGKEAWNRDSPVLQLGSVFSEESSVRRARDRTQFPGNSYRQRRIFYSQSSAGI